MTDIIQTASAADLSYLANVEGIATRAYRDIGGRITIGVGFTMGSKVFAEYWLKTRGHALRLGDTMDRAECLKLLDKLVAEEYGPPVAGKVHPAKQCEFGGSLSTAYNCGLGSLDWQWARALRMGQPDLAASILRSTALTAGGKFSAGLKKRREMDANLIEHGDYGPIPVPAAAPSVSVETEDVKAYQEQLKDLGYYTGDIDGVRGTLTRGAVTNFQKANGLKVDGIVGPATRATLARKAEQKHAVVNGAVVTAVGAGASPFLGLHVDNLVALGLGAAAVGVALYIGYMVWSHRGQLFHYQTKA